MKQLLSILGAVLVLSSCGEKPENIGSPTWPDRVPETLDFKTHVRPILVINCIECHNKKDAAKYNNLDLQTHKAAMTTGNNGPVIIPGNADGSLLIQMLAKDPQHEWAMPPTPERFWGARLEILKKWINEGAKWPAGVVLEHPVDVKKW